MNFLLTQELFDALQVTNSKPIQMAIEQQHRYQLVPIDSLLHLPDL